MVTRKKRKTEVSDRLPHKFFEPRTDSGGINRERLLKRILEQPSVRVVLLQAPAGHGKSVLLQQLQTASLASGRIVGGLNLDQSDNDLRRLSRHLQALLVTMEASRGTDNKARASSSSFDDKGSRSDALIARLLGFSAPVTLILDDYHEITSRSVHAFFHDLIEHLPDSIQLLIASRTLPEIGLARQVVNHNAMIVRAEELRFSREEVTEFFATASELEVADQELAAIYQKSEGWPAALQLFRLSLLSPSVRQSLKALAEHQPRELTDYLADNVLALQSPEVQEFLLRTSPLVRLSGPLCDHVLGRKDSTKVLLQLERSGLFLRSIDSGNAWFTYHGLFAEFLQEQLRVDQPKVLTRIHLAAALWFKDNDSLEAAIHHALAAGDESLAADVLDIWSSRLIPRGYLITVERWYEELSLDEVAKRPNLVVKVAWALCFLRRHQALKPILGILKKLRAESDDDSFGDVVSSMISLLDDNLSESLEIVRKIQIEGQSVSGFRAFELGAAANLRGILQIALGEMDSGSESIVLAKAYGDQAKAGFSLGYSVAIQGIHFVATGRLDEARERLRLGVAEPWSRLDESVAAAAMTSMYVHVLYEAGEIEAAERQFRQLAENIANFASLDFTAVAFVAMSRIQDIQGRPSQAAEFLDEADRIGHSRLWPRISYQIGWERVRRHVLNRAIDRAGALASRLTPPDNTLPPGLVMFSEDTEGEVIGRARLSLWRGQHQEALGLLENALDLAESEGRVHRQIKLRVLRSLALEASGDADGAEACFRQALESAQDGGFVRTILDEGEGVITLLRRVWTNSIKNAGRSGRVRIKRDFLEKLFKSAGIERGGTGAHGDFDSLEPLTERERKILILLGSGASNEEIANQLFVSRNTIKFHLKNVYSKLAVKSRLQAINAARAMGLIE